MTATLKRTATDRPPAAASGLLVGLCELAHELAAASDFDSLAADLPEMVMNVLAADGVALLTTRPGQIRPICRAVGGGRVAANQTADVGAPVACSVAQYYEGLQQTSETVMPQGRRMYGGQRPYFMRTGFDRVQCLPLNYGGIHLGGLEVALGDARPPIDADWVACAEAVAGLIAASLAKQHLDICVTESRIVGDELVVAAEIQRNFLPQSKPGSLPIFGINRPARVISGDFFDYVKLDDHRIAFALGDVSGKGLNAALLMAKTVSLFRCLGKSTDDPSELLVTINREICETAIRGMFVTMVAGIYDQRTGKIIFANAGHEPPLHRHPSRSYEDYPSESPPLGILPELEIASKEIDLEGGEFYLFSDGLIEFEYQNQEHLGVHGLVQILESLADKTLVDRIDTVLAMLDQGGWEARDDLTVLVIDGSWVPHHG